MPVPVVILHRTLTRYRCVLQFGAWSYFTSKMNLTTDTPIVNLESYEINGEWEILDTLVSTPARSFSWRFCFIPIQEKALCLSQERAGVLFVKKQPYETQPIFSVCAPSQKKWPIFRLFSWPFFPQKFKLPVREMSDGPWTTISPWRSGILFMCVVFSAFPENTMGKILSATNKILFQVKRNEFAFESTPDQRFSNIEFKINLRRRHTFYIMNVILPGIMTSAVLLSIFFCIPAQKVHIGGYFFLSLWTFSGLFGISCS